MSNDNKREDNPRLTPEMVESIRRSVEQAEKVGRLSAMRDMSATIKRLKAQGLIDPTQLDFFLAGVDRKCDEIAEELKKYLAKGGLR